MGGSGAKAIGNYTAGFSDLIVTVRNLILIGMMGSGKSTVGKRLALLLGRPFVDAEDGFAAVRTADRIVAAARAAGSRMV